MAPRATSASAAGAAAGATSLTWTTPSAGSPGADDAARMPYSPTGRQNIRAHQRLHVVAYDFGIKRNILRMLSDSGCRMTVVPAQTSAREVLQLAPDGVFLSNGPGDPEPCDYAIAATRELLNARSMALRYGVWPGGFKCRGGRRPVVAEPGTTLRTEVMKFEGFISMSITS